MFLYFCVWGYVQYHLKAMEQHLPFYTCDDYQDDYCTGDNNNSDEGGCDLM